MRKRLETVNGLTPHFFPYPRGTWWRRGVGKALVAAAVVLLAQPTTSATYHQARRHRARACHVVATATVASSAAAVTEQGREREAFAFVPSLSPAAVSSSFRRQQVGVQDERTAHYSSTSSILEAAAVGRGRRLRPGQGQQGVGLTTTRKVSVQPAPATSPNASDIQSVEGKNATVIITAAGGRPHTDSSRAKISASNRGKQPWNKGGNHSEATRRKIAEGTRRAALKRKEATAASLGLTLDEYIQMKKRQPAASTGISEETRLKLSERLRERWKDPAYREKRKSTMPNRTGIRHSQETKERIAAAVKARWEDPEYREKITSKVPTAETRARIGKIMRDQWADPEIRKERLAKMGPKSEEHRKKISEGVKLRWADPEYRKKTTETMRAAAVARIIATGGVPKPRRERRPRGPPGARSRESSLARAAATAERRSQREGKQKQVKMQQQVKREARMALAEQKEAAKEAKLEEERKAQEEEDKMVEGLDELDALLMRQTIRAKRKELKPKVAVRGGTDDAYRRSGGGRNTAMRDEELEEEDDDQEDVPEGFEMVLMNGRKILRMK